MTGAEVAACLGDRVDEFLAQLGGKLRELGFGELAKVGWDTDLVEEWRGR